MLTGTPLRALLQTSRGSPRPALQNPSPSEHRGVAPGVGGGGMRGSTPHTGRAGLSFLGVPAALTQHIPTGTSAGCYRVSRVNSVGRAPRPPAWHRLRAAGPSGFPFSLN